MVKVRPAWRRLAYRLGRHPLPVPHIAWPLLEVLAPEPEPVVPAAMNGHGGKPGPLVKAGADG